MGYTDERVRPGWWGHSAQSTFVFAMISYAWSNNNWHVEDHPTDVSYKYGQENAIGKKTAQETRVLRGLTFTIDWFGNRGRPDTFYDGFVYLLLLNDFSCTDQSGTVPMDGKFLVYPANETATLRKKIVLVIGVWRHASISNAGVIGSIWIPNVQNKLFTAINFLCSFGDPDFVPSFFFV